MRDLGTHGLRDQQITEGNYIYRHIFINNNKLCHDPQFYNIMFSFNKANKNNMLNYCNTVTVLHESSTVTETLHTFLKPFQKLNFTIYLLVIGRVCPHKS